jgi:FkbM family methyltransferase
MTDSVKPESAEELNRRANELASAKRYPEAESLYRQAIELEPTLAKAHGNLGTVLKHQGRLDEAEAAFRRGVALGGSAKLAANLGALLVGQGRADEIDALAKEQPPEVASALRNAAASFHESRGSILRAGAAWLEVEAVAPADAAAGLARTTLALPVAGDGEVVVPNTLELITPFVLLEQGDWFEDEIHFVRRLLRPGEAAVDVGANFGVFTLALARAVGPTGKVIAYEPASTTFAFLSATLRRNGLTQVEAVRAAVSSSPGEAVFTNADSPELSGLAAAAVVSSERTWTETVRLDTLDSASALASGRSIDFLKLDAEGEEVSILEGGARFFATHQPLVMAELRHAGVTNTKLTGKLAALGMSLHRLIPGPMVLEPLHPSLESEPFLLDVFACTPRRAAMLHERGLLGRYQDGALPTRLELGQARELVARSPTAVGAPEALLELAALHVVSASLDAADDRLATLHRAVVLGREAVQRTPTAGMFAMLVRLTAELGLRAEAKEQAERALEALRRGDLGAPLVAPLARYDAVYAAGASAKDVETSLVEYLLRRGQYSACFAEASVDRARRLVALGDPSGHGARVLDLLTRAGR